MQLRPLPARVEDEDEDDEVAVNADSDAGDTAASVLHPPSPTFIYSDAVWRSPLRARRLRAASLGNVAINDGLVEYRNSLRRVPSPPATLMRLRSVKPLPLSSANSRTPRRARQAAVQQDVAAATDGEVDQLIDTRLTLSPPRAHIDDDSKRSSNHSITPIHTNLDTTRDDGGDHDRIDSLPSHLISSSSSATAHTHEQQQQQQQQQQARDDGRRGAPRRVIDNASMLGIGRKAVSSARRVWCSTNARLKQTSLTLWHTFGPITAVLLLLALSLLTLAIKETLKNLEALVRIVPLVVKGVCAQARRSSVGVGVVIMERALVPSAMWVGDWFRKGAPRRLLQEFLAAAALGERDSPQQHHDHDHHQQRLHRHVQHDDQEETSASKCLSVWSDVFMNLVMQQPVPPPAPETNEVLRLIRRASQRHPHCFTAQLLDFVRGQPPSTTDPANAASANDPFASYFASRQPVPFNLLAPTPLALPPLV
ncbi:uncharacterized protein SPSC_03861 [Sporisorium scitamineum]|uniref:Uncharacterized protein n=1 Tax=Sporisorium scitamineum TaxID=49012 RepID=A0A127Z2Z4_9BASI|nr:uncharacterized protein SPSC_03861 [Sporisorium scitamineum]